MTREELLNRLTPFKSQSEIDTIIKSIREYKGEVLKNNQLYDVWKKVRLLLDNTSYKDNNDLHVLEVDLLTNYEKTITISKYCKRKLNINSKELADKMGLPKSTIYSWWKSTERRYLIEHFIELYEHYQKANNIKSLLFDSYMVMDHGTNEQRLKQLEKLESFFKSESEVSHRLKRNNNSCSTATNESKGDTQCLSDA